MLVGEVISRRSIPSDDDDNDDRDLDRKDRKEGASGRRKTKTEDGKVIKELEGMLDDLEVDDKEAKAASMRPPPKVKRLDFGNDVWEGTGGGREECRWLRAFLGLRDDMDSSDGMLGWEEADEKESYEDRDITNGTTADVQADSDDETPLAPARGRSARSRPANAEAIVDSDDDSLVGYSDASPSSSRSPSPTPSYLEEVANDPMLNTSTREKVQRPVYLMQLLELLRARTEAEKLEVALRWGEELIRRKRDYGTELGKHNWKKSRPGSKISCDCLSCSLTDENAEELVHQALALSDPYDLEDFENRRQGIVIALTACSPRIVAP